MGTAPTRRRPILGRAGRGGAGGGARGGAGVGLGTLGDRGASELLVTNMALWVRSAVRALRLWGRGGEPAWAFRHRFVRVAAAGRAAGGRAETGRLGVALVARGRAKAWTGFRVRRGSCLGPPRLVHGRRENRDCACCSRLGSQFFSLSRDTAALRAQSVLGLSLNSISWT